MKLISLVISTLISLLVTFTLLSCSNSDSKSGESEDALPSIQEILDDAVSSGVDGIFLYIEKSGNQPSTYSSGIENRATNTLADANSIFKIASISKLFVAVSVVKTAELGIVSLDDRLSFWLPEIAERIENGNRITILDMVRHRSGIPDFDSQTGFSWQQAHFNEDATLEYALDLPADFSPDSQYEYSNTNYLLIGKILDKALGYNHRTFVQETILTPLGLIDTHSSVSEIELDLLVKGYWEDRERSEQAYDITGGSMVSTVADIGVFLREINSVNLLFTVQEKEIYDAAYFNQHSGWLPGYQSIAGYHAASNSIIVLFVNTTGGNSESIIRSTYDKIVGSL